MRRTVSALVIFCVTLGQIEALEVQEVSGHRGDTVPGNQVVVGEINGFTLNLDRIVYGNRCLQGDLSLDVDTSARTIDVLHQPAGPFTICPLIYDPVTGVEGSFGPLTAGRWTLRDAYGNELTFDAIGSEPLAGDLDNNGDLDVNDINLLTAAIADGSAPSEYDVNSDGDTNQEDITYWIKELANSWFGDANVDGEFNSVDLVQVFQQGKYDSLEIANWSSGDWNGSGIFDSADLVIAFQDGGYEGGPRASVQSVPEPDAFLGVLMAGLMFASRYRRN